MSWNSGIASRGSAGALALAALAGVACASEPGSDESGLAPSGAREPLAGAELFHAPAWADKFKASFGGFIKVDALFSDSLVNSMDAPRFAIADAGNDEQFDLTIQHTRLIGKIDGPTIAGGGKVDAHIETDFFTLAGDDLSGHWNNARLRTRQLYVQMAWDSIEVLAGQAWDVFSPLMPETLNTNGNYWFGGNAGFRRPQARLTTRYGDASTAGLVTIKVSANANLGVADPGGKPINTGEDSGLPVFEGAVSWTTNRLPAGPATIGVSGLIGREEADTVDSRIRQQAWGIDVTLPIHERVTLKGEWQTGENADAFLMGGGFAATDGDPIEASAGWVQLGVKAAEAFTVNATAGREEFKSSTIGAGARESNLVTGLGVQWLADEAVTVGVEWLRFDTGFKGAADELANVIWGSLIFRF